MTFDEIYAHAVKKELHEPKGYSTALKNFEPYMKLAEAFAKIEVQEGSSEDEEETGGEAQASFAEMLILMCFMAEKDSGVRHNSEGFQFASFDERYKRKLILVCNDHFPGIEFEFFGPSPITFGDAFDRQKRRTSVYARYFYSEGIGEFLSTLLERTDSEMLQKQFKNCVVMVRSLRDVLAKKALIGEISLETKLEIEEVFDGLSLEELVDDLEEAFFVNHSDNSIRELKGLLLALYFLFLNKLKSGGYGWVFDLSPDISPG